MMKRLRERRRFFRSFLALILSQAGQSSSRRRPAGVSSMCCELIEPLIDRLNVCRAVALKAKLIYAILPKKRHMIYGIQFSASIVASEVLEMQSGALGCHQVIFKLKKFASCLRSSPLFVAFSDEFKGFVLLRLLCSQSPFFALVFF
jgi:hypothetical protein